MKKFVSILLALSMILTVGCSRIKTGDSSGNSHDPIPITLISTTGMETEANAVRDLLNKVGFEVTVNLYADYSTYAEVEAAHQFDISLMSWGSPSANADYAVRDLYYTGGEYNAGPVSNAKLDELIDLAASQTYEESIPTYTEIENILVEEETYMVPLFCNPRIIALNKNVSDVSTVEYGRSISRRWESLDYVDESLRDTRPFVTSQSQTGPSSFDPLRTNEGATTYAVTNTNIKLIELDPEDKVTADRSLSRSYAIAEGNDVFYFVLRDDINFGIVENGEAKDSGLMVSGEDVLFSFNRAADQNSVPTNRGYSALASMESIEMVTDLSVLEGTMVSGSDQSLLDFFNSELDAPITALTDKEAEVDNAAGSYQVIQLTTTSAFPQMLNYLTHVSLGILCEEAVTAQNEGVDANNYDNTTDVIYGDISTVTSGSSSFNNQMYCSGPYVLMSMDDYGVYFQRNPGYMPGTDDAAKIKNVTLRMIADNTTMVSALRAGEVDEAVPQGTNVAICEEDENLSVLKYESSTVYYLGFSMDGVSVMSDSNLRHAVLYAISQDDIIAAKSGVVLPAHSTLTMIPTGNVWEQDLEKAAEYIDAYFASK